GLREAAPGGLRDAPIARRRSSEGLLEPASVRVGLDDPADVRDADVLARVRIAAVDELEELLADLLWIASRRPLAAGDDEEPARVPRRSPRERRVEALRLAELDPRLGIALPLDLANEVSSRLRGRSPRVVR